MWVQARDASEDIVTMAETEADQAKLVLELQKENRELRMQLAKHQQRLMVLQAQSLAANTSPTPPSATSSLLTPPTSSAQPARKRKPRTTTSFLSATCFTPDPKKKGGAEAVAVRTLQRTVKALEDEMERMKKEHCVQMKQKDELIRELSQKRVASRGSVRPKEMSNGELKSPSHRFKSPAQPQKKRSFWDITSANSPSVTTLNGRKTRSHVVSEPTQPPSMLLQVQ